MMNNPNENKMESADCSPDERCASPGKISHQIPVFSLFNEFENTTSRTKSSEKMKNHQHHETRNYTSYISDGHESVFNGNIFKKGCQTESEPLDTRSKRLVIKLIKDKNTKEKSPVSVSGENSPLKNTKLNRTTDKRKRDIDSTKSMTGSFSKSLKNHEKMNTYDQRDLSQSENIPRNGQMGKSQRRDKRSMSTSKYESNVYSNCKKNKKRRFQSKGGLSDNDCNENEKEIFPEHFKQDSTPKEQKSREKSEKRKQHFKSFDSHKKFKANNQKNTNKSENEQKNCNESNPAILMYPESWAEEPKPLNWNSLKEQLLEENNRFVSSKTTVKLRYATKENIKKGNNEIGEILNYIIFTNAKDKTCPDAQNIDHEESQHTNSNNHAADRSNQMKDKNNSRDKWNNQRNNETNNTENHGTAPTKPETDSRGEGIDTETPEQPKSEYNFQNIHSLTYALKPLNMPVERDSLDSVFRSALGEIANGLFDLSLQNADPKLFSGRYLELQLLSKIKAYYEIRYEIDIYKLLSRNDCNNTDFDFNKLVSNSKCRYYIMKLIRRHGIDHFDVDDILSGKCSSKHYNSWTDIRTQLKFSDQITNQLNLVLEDVKTRLGELSPQNEKQFLQMFISEYQKKSKQSLTYYHGFILELLLYSELMSWMCFGVTTHNENLGTLRMAQSFMELLRGSDRSGSNAILWNIPLLSFFRMNP